VASSYCQTREVPNLWMAGPSGASNSTYTIFTAAPCGAEFMAAFELGREGSALGRDPSEIKNPWDDKRPKVVFMETKRRAPARAVAALP